MVLEKNYNIRLYVFYEQFTRVQENLGQIEYL
jgi:hypothetical protein